MRLICLIGSLIIISTGCIPIARSARGLDRGELAATFHAIGSGDLRYGFTDKVEGRFSIIAESYEMDMNYHQRIGDYNGSITFGTQWLPDYENGRHPFLYYLNPLNSERLALGGGLTISREFTGKFIFNYDVNPYLGYSQSFPMKDKYEFWGFFAVGMETRLKFKYFNILLTPELQILVSNFGETGDFVTPIWGSFGMGLAF